MRAHCGVLLGLVASIAMPAAAQVPAHPVHDTAAVLAAVDELFDVMAARDTARARALLLPEGRFVAVRPTTDGYGMAMVTSHAEFIELLASGGPRLLERYWDPQVLVHGPIAVVWTPYDFFRDGAFSHCGVDAFTLVRRPDRWMITGVTYTIEVAGCVPSPLGPPAADAVP